MLKELPSDDVVMEDKGTMEEEVMCDEEQDDASENAEIDTVWEKMEIGRLLRDSEFDDVSMKSKQDNWEQDVGATSVVINPDHQHVSVLIALSVQSSSEQKVAEFFRHAKDTFSLDLDKAWDIRPDSTKRGKSSLILTRYAISQHIFVFEFCFRFWHSSKFSICLFSL